MLLPRKSLTETLRHVDSVISADSADVYKLTRLFAASGTLYAAGSDGDIMVVARCPAEGDLPEICIDSRTLLGVVRNAPGDDVSLDIDGTQVVIRSGRSKFKLSWLHATMPEFTYKAEAEPFEIDGTALADALRRVRYAVSQGQGRHYLEGVHFHAVDGALRIVAMDGHRLAFADLGAPAECRMTVPTKTVNVLMGLTGTLRLTLGTNGMSVASDGVTVMSKVIADDFADYQRVVPTSGQRIVFNGQELRRAAARVGMIVNEKTRVVRVSLNGETAVISSISQGGNEASEEIPCSGGGGLEVGLNIKYLNDALASFGDKDIEMMLESNHSPILVREVGGGSVSAVLTPFRLN